MYYIKRDILCSKKSRKRRRMKKENALEYIAKNKPPALFGTENNQLLKEYAGYLKAIGAKTAEEKKMVLDLFYGMIDDVIAEVSERSRSDYENGITTNEDEVILRKTGRYEKKEITNIPPIIADWMGLIAYAAKTYKIN